MKMKKLIALSISLMLGMSMLLCGCDNINPKPGALKGGDKKVEDDEDDEDEEDDKNDKDEDDDEDDEDDDKDVKETESTEETTKETEATEETEETTKETKATEETEETTKETKETKETESTVSPSADEDYQQLYLDFVDYYVANMNYYKEHTEEIPDEDMWYYDALAMHNPIDVAWDFGYIMQDVNDDGIDELVIVQDTSPNVSLYENLKYISAVYTVNDKNEIALVFSGWSRNSYYYLGDSEFFTSGSAGAGSSMFGTFTLDKDFNFIWNDFYFTEYNIDDDDLCIYHNTTGDWDADSSETVSEDAVDNYYFDILENERYQYDDDDIVYFVDYAVDCDYDIDIGETEIYVWETEEDYWNKDESNFFIAPNADKNNLTYVFISNESLTFDFELLYFDDVKVDDNGDIVFTVESTEYIPVMRAYEGVVYGFTQNEYLPSVGIYFTDYDENEYAYMIMQSGEDGSFYFEPFYWVED